MMHVSGLGILGENTLGIGAGAEDPALCQIAWRGQTKNPVVERIQKKLNTQLVALGYEPITADGFFGPATCGALDLLVGKDTARAAALLTEDVLLPECPNGVVLPTCVTSTPPRKKSAPRPGSELPPPTDDSTTMAIVGGGAALLLVGGALWMFAGGRRRSSGSRTTRRMSSRTTRRLSSRT
jgi:hypothetical protein